MKLRSCFKHERRKQRGGELCQDLTEQDPEEGDQEQEGVEVFAIQEGGVQGLMDMGESIILLDLGMAIKASAVGQLLARTPTEAPRPMLPDGPGSKRSRVCRTRPRQLEST